MIRYTLTCDQNHQFESWFQSSDAFDSLKTAGHLACSVCGSFKVERALMAPSVRPKTTSLAAPQSEIEAALTAMRKHVEANSEYVGVTFAKEARKIHEGDAPDRAIYGEAKLDEAKKLIEEGIPVAPLPFMPKRKAN